MQDKKMTQKERRAASDAKIIRSAIKCFGEDGYTHSTIVNIAKGAGVTGGLLVQRFESKEKLLTEAYRNVVHKITEDIPDANNFIFVLIRNLDNIKRLSKDDPAAFDFLKMIFNSSDLPEGFISSREEGFKEIHLYRTMIDAQNKGIIAKGDPQILFYSFVIQVFFQIELTQKYGLPFPEDDYFFRTFSIADDEKVRTTKRKEKLLDLILRDCVSLTFIDIKNNCVEEMVEPPEIRKILDVNDAQGTIFRVIEEGVCERDKNRIHRFTDFSTISERMKDVNYLIEYFIDVNGNKMAYTLGSVKRDSEGTVLELLAAVRIVL